MYEMINIKQKLEAKTTEKVRFFYFKKNITFNLA